MYFEFPLALIAVDDMVFVLVRSGGVFESRVRGSSCLVALPWAVPGEWRAFWGVILNLTTLSHNLFQCYLSAVLISTISRSNFRSGLAGWANVSEIVFLILFKWTLGLFEGWLLHVDVQCGGRGLWAVSSVIGTRAWAQRRSEISGTRSVTLPMPPSHLLSKVNTKMGSGSAQTSLQIMQAQDVIQTLWKAGTQGRKHNWTQLFRG